MFRVRLMFPRTPATVLAILAGAAVASCRPAVDPGPKVSLDIRTQPRDVRIGVAIATPPVVEVVDRRDPAIARPSMGVQATIQSGLGQILSGGEVSVVDGLATFPNLILVGPADANIRLQFQLYEDLVPVPSAIALADTFRLIAGPATGLSAQSPTSIAGTPGQAVSPSPSVIVKDAGGNPLAGATVTFAIAAGEGRITGAAESLTNAQGVATVSGWVLGLPGTNQLKATVSASDVTFTATVTSTVGMLRIRVAGAPQGGLVKVRVLKTSASGTIYDVIQDVRDSLTVTGLPFGTYQVSGDSVSVGGRLWLADASAGGLNVSATSGPSIALNYREYGRFEITARGLPGPTLSAILDFQPTAGESALLFSVSALNDAVTRSVGPVGTYDVVPRLVSAGGQQYAATPARQSTVLGGGATANQLNVNYAVITGSLVVTLAGTLPAGAAPQIDVSGPGGFHETVFMSGTRTWTGLAPGNYTVVASPITVGGTLFRPTPATSNVSVTAGNQTLVTTTYNP